MNLSLLILIALSFACGLATAYLAQARGRSFARWLVWGTLFAPVGLVAALLVPKRPELL